ncbi:MAG: hypothetical protein L0Z55_05655 [Planctomycetes bacterium]|nr:hypothetical protein [Planctomycetota bacterium]
MVATGRPSFQDADLIIRLYELRREAVMRESRNAIGGKFWPRNYEEFFAITKPEDPLNAAFRQVSSYWEMVYGMARHQIVHPEYLVENSTEGFFLFAKVAPYLERFRKDTSPYAFQHAEWVVTQTAEGRRRFELVQARVKKMMEARQGAPVAARG